MPKSTGPDAPFNLSVEVALDRDERQRLAALAGSMRRAGLLDVDGDDRALVGAILAAFAAAGVQEHLEQTVRERPPSSAAQARDLRFALLVVHLFRGRLPTAALLQDLFGLTPAEARSMLGRVPARLSRLVGPARRETAARALRAATPGDKTAVLGADDSVVAYLSELALRSGLRPPPIRRRADAVGEFDIDKDTWEAVVSELGEDIPWPEPAKRRRRGGKG